ncbi:MAG: hypothetical protein IPM40_20395 [Gammaproteobacteria bacterium]|nr:hypothetical protein [Gammaproteobacteria bacterium]
MPDTARASWEVFQTLITMDGAPVKVGLSVGHPRILNEFARITNGPLAPAVRADGFANDVAPGALSRTGIARKLAPVERVVATVGIPLALLALLVWSVIAVRQRRLDPGLVIGLVLAAAVATRVVLLGFLEATSIPEQQHAVPVAGGAHRAGAGTCRPVRHRRLVPQPGIAPGRAVRMSDPDTRGHGRCTTARPGTGSLITW